MAGYGFNVAADAWSSGGDLGNPRDFASSILHLMDMSPTTRRSIAFASNLRELTWRERLKNLVPLLEEVSRVRVTVH